MRTAMRTLVSRGGEPDWGKLDFPVVAAPVHARVNGEDVHVPRQALVRVYGDDRYGVLRVVGEDYILTPHGDVFSRIHEEVTSRHMVRDVETLVGGGGTSARVVWTLYVADIVPPAGQALRQVVAYNGYDGRTALRVIPGGLAVSDGTELRVPDSGSGQRHRGAVDLDVLEDYVTEALNADLSTTWAGWNAMRLGQERFSYFLESCASLGMKARVEVLHRFMVAGPGTLWGAYRAMAWYATYAAQGKDPHTLLARRERIHADALKLVTET